MNDKELFLYLKNKGNYKTAGLDVQYDIVPDPKTKTISLYFEETHSKYDWLINFNFPQKVYKHQESKFYVHGGYVKAWKSCNDLIMAEFIAAFQKYSDYTPVISGWSYGGAISILAAEDFCYRTGIKPELITFGAPKILYFKESRDYFYNNCKIARQYVRVNDIVTWVIPFPWVYHVNKFICKEKFSLKKLLHPELMHTSYEEVI